jgi:hypothetical protein
MDEPQLVRVSLPRKVWVALALLALVPMVTLALQLRAIEAQREIVEDQRAIAQRQIAESLPLIRDGRLLADEAVGSLPQIAAIGRRSDRLTREATPLVEELRAARLEEVVRAVGALSRGLLEADAQGATRQLGAALPDLAALVREVRARDLVRRSAVAADAVLDVRRIAAETLAVQREALAVLRRSEGVQDQARQHVRNIDRRTGGGTALVPGG